MRVKWCKPVGWLKWRVRESCTHLQLPVLLHVLSHVENGGDHVRLNAVDVLRRLRRKR
jgi:hypothetical protein